MKESKLINIISLGFIISHFVIIVGIIFFRFIGWYDTETVKICLPVVTPLFATYTTIIITYITQNKSIMVETPNESKVHFLFAFVAIFVPSVFIAVMMGILYNQGVNPLSKDDLTFFLGLGETLFGVFLGLIIKSIFKNPDIKSEQKESVIAQIPKL